MISERQDHNNFRMFPVYLDIRSALHFMVTIGRNPEDMQETFQCFEKT